MREVIWRRRLPDHDTAFSAHGRRQPTCGSEHDDPIAMVPLVSDMVVRFATPTQTQSLLEQKKVMPKVERSYMSSSHLKL